MMISASADEKLRIWDMALKTVSKAMPFDRPSDKNLMKFRNLPDDDESEMPAAIQSSDEEEKDLPDHIPDPNAGENDQPLPRKKKKKQKALPPRMQHDYPTCIAFAGTEP